MQWLGVCAPSQCGCIVDTIVSLKLVTMWSTRTVGVRKMMETVSGIVPVWMHFYKSVLFVFLSLPRSSFGTSDTSSLILLKIRSKNNGKNSLNASRSLQLWGKLWGEKEGSVRWCPRRRRRRCCCWDSPGYILLLSSYSVRTMYPRLFKRISVWRGGTVQGLMVRRKTS